MIDANRYGCVCQSCGSLYRADLLVPDEVWAQISPQSVDGFKGGGLLCPSCILHRIVDAGIWTAAYAIHIDDRAKSQLFAPADRRSEETI